MRRALPLSLALLVLLPLAARPASAAELAGVTLDDSAQVGDQQLVLNGLGLRKKFFVKVYVAGLYLPEKQSDAGAILASDGARRMVMQFVRGVSAGQLNGGWEECLENNSPNASAQVEKDFGQLSQWMDDVEDGDQIVFTWAGESTDVSLKGASKGTIAGKDFADALFACWIGPEPPGEDFKQGVLGH